MVTSGGVARLEREQELINERFMGSRGEKRHGHGRIRGGGNMSARVCIMAQRSETDRGRKGTMSLTWQKGVGVGEVERDCDEAGSGSCSRCNPSWAPQAGLGLGGRVHGRPSRLSTLLACVRRGWTKEERMVQSWCRDGADGGPWLASAAVADKESSARPAHA